jgi:predicted transcriptional regulator
MAVTSPVSVRLSAETRERLARLAESTGRSQAWLAAEAIDAYVDLNEWQVGAIQAAIDEADAGGPFAAHDDVKAWLGTWGGKQAKPAPKAKTRRR